MSGVESLSAITFIDATFSTKDGDVKNYPAPIFGEWLITQIYEIIKRFAIKKGLFRKKFLCSGCLEELNVEIVRPIETEHQLQLDKFPPFRIRINLPSVECPHCRKICGIDLDGSASFNLNEAIMHAFESENIRP
jgi:hypothetical protein